MSTQQDIADALRTVAGVAQAAAPVLPEPFGVAARILGAAAGAASVAIDAGKSEAEVVASIHRIRAIDTSAQDAEVDARVAAKPSRLQLAGAVAIAFGNGSDEVIVTSPHLDAILGRSDVRAKLIAQGWRAPTTP